MAALVPLTIDHAWHGDFAPFVAETVGLDQGFSRNMSLGLFFSIVCREDVPFIRPREIDRIPPGFFFGPRLTRELVDACSVWPHGVASAAERARTTSSAPTLLLSGELDPVTPPAWAEDAKRTLSHSLHVVVPGVGHNTVGADCARTLMNDLLTRGSVEGLTPSCGTSLTRPPFFTSFAGPVP
jgi:pimeloyl-ACP methyl ester carboxylesterase